MGGSSSAREDSETEYEVKCMCHLNTQILHTHAGDSDNKDNKEHFLAPQCLFLQTKNKKILQTTGHSYTEIVMN